MNNIDQKNIQDLKGEYMDIRIPEHGLQEMQKRIEAAKRDKRTYKRQKCVRRFCGAVAAALVLFVLPNTSAGLAHAMGNIPILGGLFQVITIREYRYEDEKHLIMAKVPQVEVDGEELETLNVEMTEYLERLLQEFRSNMSEEAYQALEIDYTVITDTDQWFTLELCAVETAASGYEFRKYYHIDKNTDKIVGIMDLLQNDDKRVQAVSQEISRQMQSQIEEDGAFYYLKNQEEPDGFEVISQEQNFYFNSEGQLVIVFDEYNVAPGSEGCPEFVIEDHVWKSE